MVVRSRWNARTTAGVYLSRRDTSLHSVGFIDHCAESKEDHYAKSLDRGAVDY